jgi:hypothetical protein
MVHGAGFLWVDSAKDLAAMFKTIGLSSRSNGPVHGYDVTREDYWMTADI